MRYGRSSEQMDAQQLELLAQNAPANPALVIDLQVERARRAGQSTKRPDLRHLPEHLPRETVVHEHSHGADCTCVGCGSGLRDIGQEVSEVLDYEPGSFKVVRHVRPKYACGQCNSICQAEASERPIERGMAGAGLLAHVLTSKYCDHLPLYRQNQIYRRVGVDLHRSTLADWVGQTSALLRPLVDSLARHVMQGAKVHADVADDTPVSVLDPGRGRTKIARLWAYVRDDRPAADLTPPAVWFQYTPDRKGENPARHLRAFHGILQADGYAGFNALYDPTRQAGVILEAACWAHVRRKFYEIHEDQKRLPGTLAAQALLSGTAKIVDADQLPLCCRHRVELLRRPALGALIARSSAAAHDPMTSSDAPTMEPARQEGHGNGFSAELSRRRPVRIDCSSCAQARDHTCGSQSAHQEDRRGARIQAPGPIRPYGQAHSRGRAGGRASGARAPGDA